jgi:hypothetical protein
MRRVCSFNAACIAVVLFGNLDLVAGLILVALPEVLLRAQAMEHEHCFQPGSHNFVTVLLMLVEERVRCL